MASLQRRSSGLYMVAFRYQGERLLRSLETHDEAEAARLVKHIEERLKHLREGILVLPDGSSKDELWEVLRRGRISTTRPTLVKTATLASVAEAYLKSYPSGSKETESLGTERVHLNNFKRLLGARKLFHAIAASDLRNYISRRQLEPGIRGGNVAGDTIRKELQTFRLVWHFAKRDGFVSGESPLKGIKLPKKRRKPPFQTWEQIEQRIVRGGLSEIQIHEMWECLFLREEEIGQFLRHAKLASAAMSRFPYIYPALCFCAYTGARRSEMFRCLIDDVSDGWILIREKKRDKDTDFTFRQIPLSQELALILAAWREIHPGGQYLFCKNNRHPLDDRSSREAFKAVTKASRWKVLRGYHILRHSFASNLARSGRVSQAEIDELMGHQTEEMRLRYRHLFPEDKQRAVEVLSYNGRTQS